MDLDIIMTGNPPIFKAMDYLSLLQELSEKEKDKVEEKGLSLKLKEIIIRPKIETNDYQTKIDQLKKFLEKGHRVKIISQAKKNVTTEETFQQLTVLQDEMCKDKKVVVVSPIRTEKSKSYIEFIRKK